MKLGLHSYVDNQLAQYDSFSTWIGQTCISRTTFADYSSWSGLESPFMLSTTKTWLQRGTNYQEIMSIGMCPFTGSPSSTQIHLSDVASGTYDSHWQTLGTNINTTLGSLQNQLVIRLGWEFNGNWYQWGIQSPNTWNTPSIFVSAFQHIVTQIRSKAPNVKFAWNMSLTAPMPTGGLSACYPGNSYVDIISIDVYDAYNGNKWSNIVNGGSGVMSGGLAGWRSFALTQGKPEGYSEWGCDTHAGNGDNPNFIAMMYHWMKSVGSNGVDHHCYWNTSSGGPNAAIQGPSVGQITGSISGTTLTVSAISSSSHCLIAAPQLLLTADPINNPPIAINTNITGFISGSGTNGGVGQYTIDTAQTVASQTINCIPTPQSAQLYQTLFNQNPSVQKIAVTNKSGILVPSSTLPKNYACICDGSYYYVIVNPN